MARKQLLRRIAILLVPLAFAGVTAACGGDDTPAEDTSGMSIRPTSTVVGPTALPPGYEELQRASYSCDVDGGNPTGSGTLENKTSQPQSVSVGVLYEGDPQDMLFMSPELVVPANGSTPWSVRPGATLSTLVNFRGCTAYAKMIS